MMVYMQTTNYQTVLSHRWNKTKRAISFLIPPFINEGIKLNIHSERLHTALLGT